MNSRGPVPAHIYRRRRLTVLAALVVALVLLVLLIRAIIGASFGADPTAAPAAPSSTAATAASGTATSTATSSATASGAACAADALKVTPTTAAETVKVAQQTKVGMTIENAGPTPCTLDAGSGNLELVISSGNERIWSSDDCQKAGENRPTEVAPGGKLESTVAWEVNRSAQGCPTTLAPLKAGTYALKARVGDVTSDSTTFTVEG